MLILSVRVGEAVQIGEVACVKVLEKSGRVVRLAIATAIKPIQIIASGIIPQRFTYGVTGEPRPVEEGRRMERVA